MRYFFIVNPMSCGGRSKKIFERLLILLSQKAIDFRFQYTSSLEDAQTISCQANKNGYDLIVAVGGDGTINKVINGFYHSTGKRISSAKMGVVYSGTSPDFCKSYNIPVDPLEALDVLLENYSTLIEIGKISLTNEKYKELDEEEFNDSKNTTIKYFGCCVNIGLGATLARKANSGIRKYLGDFLGTFISLINTLFIYKANNFAIIKDGKIMNIEKLYNISIGKTKYIASGIKVANSLKKGDHKFYSLTVQKLDLINFASSLKKVYSGKPFKNSKSISLDYCERIEIYGNNNNPEIEFDGDPQGYLPCIIEMADDGLDLIIKR